MELHVATLKPFLPPTGSRQEWNAAHYRLDDYLKAHGLRDRILQSQLVLRLLERAALQHQLDPSQSPVRLAVTEADRAMSDWFRMVLILEGVDPCRVNSMGRVCLYLTDAMERWPQIFLADGGWPAEFATEMQGVSFASGPDLRISTMIPRTLDDVSPVELLEKAWDSFSKNAIASLVAISALAGFIWLFL